MLSNPFPSQVCYYQIKADRRKDVRQEERGIKAKEGKEQKDFVVAAVCLLVNQISMCYDSLQPNYPIQSQWKQKPSKGVGLMDHKHLLLSQAVVKKFSGWN